MESKKGYVEVHLLFYRGYIEKFIKNEGMLHAVFRNNVVKVIVPLNYMGHILISFWKLWYWKLVNFGDNNKLYDRKEYLV